MTVYAINIISTDSKVEKSTFRPICAAKPFFSMSESADLHWLDWTLSFCKVLHISAKSWFHWNYVSCVNCEEYWNYKCILEGLTFQPSNISLGVEILCLTPDQKVTGLVSILVLKCPWVTRFERHQCVTLTVKLVGPQSRCKIIMNTRRLHSGAKLSNILHRVICLHYVS